MGVYRGISFMELWGVLAMYSGRRVHLFELARRVYRTFCELRVAILLFFGGWTLRVRFWPLFMRTRGQLRWSVWQHVHSEL